MKQKLVKLLEAAQMEILRLLLLQKEAKTAIEQVFPNQ